jgi:hypothetical protein
MIKLKNGGLAEIPKKDKAIQKELFRESKLLCKELDALGKLDEKRDI